MNIISIILKNICYISIDRILTFTFYHSRQTQNYITYLMRYVIRHENTWIAAFFIPTNLFLARSIEVQAKSPIAWQ